MKTSFMLKFPIRNIMLAFFFSLPPYIMPFYRRSLLLSNHFPLIQSQDNPLVFFLGLLATQFHFFSYIFKTSPTDDKSCYLFRRPWDSFVVAFE